MKQRTTVKMLKYVLCNVCQKSDHNRDELSPLASAALTSNVAYLRDGLNSREKKTINEFFGKREWKLQLTPLQWCLTGPPSPDMVECVKLLIEAGADVNLKYPWHEQTAVHMAAQKENLSEVLMLLLENGGNVNEPDKTRNLPLHYICRHTKTTESLTCFRRVIKDTLYINSRNKIKKIAFSIAVDANNCQIVEELADYGCDINVCGGSYIFEMFSGGMKNQNPKSEMIRTLIHLGCNVNDTDENGTTQLMLAVSLGDAEYVNALLKHGADVDARNKSGYSAFDYCFYYTENDILKILLQSDTQINIAQLAIKHLRHIQGDSEALEILVAKGFDIHHIGERDENILHFLARYSGDLDIFDYYCDQVNVNRADVYGITPLMVAADCAPEYQKLKILLDAGSDPNIQDKNGRTALQYLNTNVMEKYCNSLKLLLQHGGALSLDIKTSSGFTPLQYVLDTERFSMFWHLLAENCTVTSLDTPRSCTEPISFLTHMAYLAYERRAQQILYRMKTNKVMLGKILYLCGAPTDIIKKYYKYCNNMSLRELCVRVLRNAIGAGIQQKLSKDCQIPGLFHDFIMLKHIFLPKVFDPHEISDYDIDDKDNIFDRVDLNHVLFI